jgi:hypothetical protein
MPSEATLLRALSQLPALPSRRQEIERLSFQSLKHTAEQLKRWFDLDVFDGLTDDDRTFVHLMLNRRHILEHRGGAVDQAYLTNTGDTRVRLHQVIVVVTEEVRRFWDLVKRITSTLMREFESIQP